MPTAQEAVDAYIAAQTEVNDQQDAAIDNITADVKWQADTIAALQATGNTWTDADQAKLDAMQVRTKATLDKLAALDALTNPTPPTA